MSTKVTQVGVPKPLFCTVIPPSDAERVRIHDGAIANAMLVRGCLGGAFSEMWFDPQLITAQTVGARLQRLQEQLGITFEVTFVSFWEVEVQLSELIPRSARRTIQTKLRRLGVSKAIPRKGEPFLALRFEALPVSDVLDEIVAALSW